MHTVIAPYSYFKTLIKMLHHHVHVPQCFFYVHFFAVSIFLHHFLEGVDPAFISIILLKVWSSKTGVVALQFLLLQ